MEPTTVAVDPAKSVFQVVDASQNYVVTVDGQRFLVNTHSFLGKP